MILKNTTAYSLGQIGYSIIENSSLKIWSTKTISGEFHATELVQLFSQPFSSYISYNKEMELCELIIF